MHYKQIALAVISILSIGCSETSDPYEIELRRDLIAEQISQNKWCFDNLAEGVADSATDDTKAAFAKCLSMKSWQEKYEMTRRRDDLILFTDSVINLYNRIPEKDDQIAHAIHDYSRHVARAGDSLHVLNLYIHVLFAEEVLLGYYGSFFKPRGFYTQSTFTSLMEKPTFPKGDTARLLLETIRSPGDWHIDLAKIKCTNQQTSRSLYPTVKRIGHFYLLEYYPSEKGEYMIRGEVRFSSANHQDQRPVLQKFIVN